MSNNDTLISNFIEELEEKQESLFFIPDDSIDGDFTDQPVRGSFCVKDSFGPYVKISDMINQKTSLEKSGFPDSTTLNTSQGFQSPLLDS